MRDNKMPGTLAARRNGITNASGMTVENLIDGHAGAAQQGLFKCKCQRGTIGGVYELRIAKAV